MAPSASGSVASASSAAQANGVQQKSKDQPCDQCRTKRKLCSKGRPCDRCAAARQACTFLLPRRKNDSMRGLWWADLTATPPTSNPSPTPSAPPAAPVAVQPAQTAPTAPTVPQTPQAGPRDVPAHFRRYRPAASAFELDLSLAYDDGSANSASSTGSAASAPVSADLAEARERYMQSIQGVTEWMQQMTLLSRPKIPTVSEKALPRGALAATGATRGARGARAKASANGGGRDSQTATRGAALELPMTIPMVLVDMCMTHELPKPKVEELCKHPAAAGVPVIFGREPCERGTIALLQAGKQAFLMVEDPDSPGYHPPPELCNRPLRMGQSVRSADPNADYVLFFDADGTVQAAPPDELPLDSRAIFGAEWVTTGPAGRQTSPPWWALASDECTSLWPGGSSFREGDYFELLVRGKTLLAGELCATFMQEDSENRRLLHRFAPGLIIKHTRPLTDGPASQPVPAGWSPLQARQRMAFMLATAAGIARRSRRHAAPERPHFEVTLGGVFMPSTPPEQSAALVRDTIWGWEFSDGLIKLAWALLHPRTDGKFDKEELTLDALVALMAIHSAMSLHPLFADMSKVVWRFLQAPETQAAVLADIGSDEDRLEIYRRLIDAHLLDLVAFRLWRDRALPIRLGPLHRSLGEIRKMSDERFVDESVHIPVDYTVIPFRHQIELFRMEGKLAELNEELLDSALIDGDRSMESQQRKIDEALHFHRAFSAWYTTALDDKAIEQGVPPFDREAAAAARGGWAFAFDPHFLYAQNVEYYRDLLVVSIELVLAALEVSFPEGSHGEWFPDVDSPSQEQQLCQQAQALKTTWTDFRASIPEAKGTGVQPDNFTLAPGFATGMTALHGRASRRTPPPLQA